MKCIVLFYLLYQASGLERRQLLRAVPALLTMKKEKYCKDCKYFKKDFFTETKYGHCSRFLNQPTNDYSLVDGVKDMSPASYHYCATARKFDDMCGPEAKYFESKN